MMRRRTRSGSSLLSHPFVVALLFMAAWATMNQPRISAGSETPPTVSSPHASGTTVTTEDGVPVSTDTPGSSEGLSAKGSSTETPRASTETRPRRELSTETHGITRSETSTSTTMHEDGISEDETVSLGPPLARDTNSTTREVDAAGNVTQAPETNAPVGATTQQQPSSALLTLSSKTNITISISPSLPTSRNSTTSPSLALPSSTKTVTSTSSAMPSSARNTTLTSSTLPPPTKQVELQTAPKLPPMRPPCLPTESGEYMLRLKGVIQWDMSNSRRGDCPHIRKWIIAPFPGRGIGVKIFRIYIYGNYTLEFYEGATYDPRKLLRRYTQSKSPMGFAPLLVRNSSLSIVLEETAYGFCEFNISFSGFLREFMPVESTNFILPNSSLKMYDCHPDGPVPEVFQCDMVEQCLDGKDEENCAYKEDGSCGDWIPYGDYCLKALYLAVSMGIPGHTTVAMPLQAEEECRSKYGATLAILPDKNGIDLVESMIRHSGFFAATIGIKKVKPQSAQLRHLYRFLWQWGDRGSSIAYEQQTIQRDGPLLDCAMMRIHPQTKPHPIQCALPKEMPQGFVCMRKNPTKTVSQPSPILRVHFPEPAETLDQFPTKQCSDGSLVQSFHRCLWEDYESEMSAWSESNLPVFQCRFGQTVHYTLVCDGIPDCPDRSDEMNCVVPRFSPLLEASFKCRGSQTIPVSLKCNGKPDCFDESDEEDCVSCGRSTVMCAGAGCIPSGYAKYIDTCPVLSESEIGPLRSILPATVRMDGTGMSLLFPAEHCSEAEFQCHNRLCVPAFLVNNGEKDCLFGEDENIPKENMTCPGYYRCQDVGLCVHKDHVCDGVYHCPNKDDERYCDLTCPDNCTCEGYAYTCSEMFDPHMHLYVRYLDLSTTLEPSLKDIHVMEYIQFLNLSSCSLKNLTLSNMPQLKILDLSFNALKGLTSLMLEQLSGLTNLNVSGNPFVQNLDVTFSSFVIQADAVLLQVLTMKNTDLTSIEDGVFAPLPELRTLDLRGNDVKDFDKNVFLGLNQLHVLYTDNHKLCCSYFHSALSECHAPVDELSSCDDLLRVDFFRVFLWSFSVLAIVGNACSLIYRLYSSRRSGVQKAYTVLVANLSASDLLMGVYMMMIGSADLYFRGVYVSNEAKWKESRVCKMAGFLAFLSSEVSAFAICLITLDRFLVLCFPFKSHLRMTVRTTLISCSTAWVVGATLAAVPLMAQWEFYGQNGICIPLPITRQQYQGQQYAFGVFIVLNFVLFLLIGAGQVYIFWSVRSPGTQFGTERRQQDMTIARRLFTIAFTDFLCWFPVGLMGLLASQGVPIPGVVNVWVAIFVLPLNSALNPFLYTLNSLADRWAKHRDDKQMKKMMGKLHSEIPKWTQATVEELTRICLRTKLVKQERVLQWLGFNQNAHAVVESGSEDFHHYEETAFTELSTMSSAASSPIPHV